MLRKLSFLSLIIIFSTYKLSAQDWVKKMQDPSVNFYDVKKSFNAYWKKEERKEKFKSFFIKKKKTEEENEGYMMYKRWEAYVEPRVFPSGDRTIMEAGNQEILKQIMHPAQKSMRMAGGNWSPLGAFNVPLNGGGAGRVNCIRFLPGSSTKLFTGAPAGGLWQSPDNGISWSTSTDELPTLGVSDIAIDPVNNNIIYVATGDDDATDTYSVGVLKSIDGGSTWSITGLNYTTVQTKKVGRILINPNNHNMLFAGTSTGLYKSIDAGVTWVRASAQANIKDIEFKPGDPSVIYAASAGIYLKSTDTGNTFSSSASGLPSSSAVSRLALAVSPANPAIVYALYSDMATNAFYGIYRSNDSGNTFTLQTNSPNMLGYQPDGSDASGQGWYTLSIAVSPFDADEVAIGGVNIWMTYNGGLNWTCVAHWYGANGLPYVHADIHDLNYRFDGSLFAGCDGGLFESDNHGNSWLDKSAGMQIGEMYRLGCSATDPNLVIQGWQDNGCNLYNNTNWTNVIGGDGMECFIDWSDANYMYGEYQSGAIQASTNGGATFNDISSSISETGQWITPWCQDPITPQTLYAGYQNVWKSTDRGNTWNPISSFNSNGLTCLAVAHSNPNYIYASAGATLYKTSNGGTSWTQFSIPINSGAISYITVSTTNPLTLWVSISGYYPTCKVFKSIDGGVTWKSLALNLPNIPVNCLVNQTGTADGVYIGTDVGVYYLDTTITSWIPFSNGLPNVVVDELEIQYGSGKLRAATFGRGLWETNINNPLSNKPFANFNGDTLSGCPGFAVHFYDSTLHSPTSWQWRFPGGTPSTSTLQNPIVNYNTPGTYNNVTLVVTNSFGTDSITKLSYIAVSPQVQPVITNTGNDSLCSGQHIQLVSSLSNSYHWLPNNLVYQQIIVNHTGVFTVTTTDVFNCTTTSAPVNIYVFTTPAIPVITEHGDTLFSSSASNNQWYMNGNILSGATNHYYIATTGGGTYSVTVKDSSGFCSSTSSNFVGINEIASNGISYSLYPNPASNKVTLVIGSTSMDNITTEITDVLGNVIYSKEYSAFAGRMETEIDLSNYSNAVYFLTIRNSKGKSIRKLVVSH